MSLTTTVATGTTIQQTYAPGFVEGVYRNNALMPIFGAPVDSGGDEAYRWKINSAGNSSVELYTEDQAQPAIGNQTFVNAAVSYLAFRYMVRITGHARAALRSNWINAIDEEFTLGQQDLIDLITTTYMASTYGIEAAIAATGTYAGITRGSVGYFESTSTAISRALELNDIIDHWETIQNADKGGMPSALICNLNQVTNIWRLGGGPGIKNMDYSDAAPSLYTQTFAGRPIIGMPDFTTTTIATLDLRPGHWVVVEHQPFQVKEMAPSGDSDVTQVSYMGVIVGKNPKCDGKLTSVTA